MKIFRFLVLLHAVACAGALVVCAQPARRDFNRPQTFDAQHYAIRVSFDRAAKRVLGDTTVSVKPLAAGFRVMELDAEALSVTTVRLAPDGNELKFESRGTRLVVTLDRAYSPNETVSVRVVYTAIPRKGVYFVDADATRSAQIWTQGEPDEARHWFPSFDFPSDKATTEQYITAEKGETVIANGELVDKRDNADGTETWYYRMPVPHPVYLVSFVVGRYAKITERYKDIPLSYYIYPGKEATVKSAYGETREMMRVMEELTGVAYPFNKYDQTVVAGFQFGGMENITATTMADTEIFLADFEFGKDPVRDLVSHELAHSWFGNLVTCRNWAELWLNEGFATYMEAAYIEKTRGRSAYLDKIRSDAAQFLVNDTVNRSRHGLFNQRAGDVSSLFDNAAITYHKGGAVVHTLREQVGTAAFWRGIKIYLERHRFASVESADLKRAMEEASGRQLQWFFDQWIYAAGSPRLDVRSDYSPRKRILTVTITQTQVADALTPAAFRLPLDVGIKIGNQMQAETIEVTKRIQAFSFKVAGRPTSLTIDRDEKVPVKRVRIRPILAGR